MQINKIDNTNFQAVKTGSAQNLLFSRLGRPKRYLQFYDFANAQEKKDYDIVLSGAKNSRIYATVYKDGEPVLTEKEGLLSGILNLNPLKFLSNVSEKADKLFK